MKSVKEGYNQLVEDELLATLSWEDDGYKLFDISVYAASSHNGWFSLPNETNAFFMRRGGFERHQAPWLIIRARPFWPRHAERVKSG